MRDEIRKAAAGKQREAPALAAPPTARLRPAEQGLLWTLVHRPVEGLAAVAQLDVDDVTGLASAGILTLAASLGDVPPDFVPALLRERLNDAERGMVDRAAAATMPPAGPVECVQAIRRMRIERDIAAVQEEIDRLQTVPGGSDDRLALLWTKKKELLTQL